MVKWHAVFTKLISHMSSWLSSLSIYSLATSSNTQGGFLGTGRRVSLVLLPPEHAEVTEAEEDETLGGSMHDSDSELEVALPARQGRNDTSAKRQRQGSDEEDR